MVEQIRKNPFCVISIDTYGEHKMHDIQTNSSWTKNPYGERYAVVPEDILNDILATDGYCDIELNEDGTEVVSFSAREIPEIPEPQMPVSKLEQIRADVDYIAIMSGVEL